MKHTTKKLSALVAGCIATLCFTCASVVVPVTSATATSVPVTIAPRICAFLCLEFIEFPLAYAACFAACSMYEPKM